MKKPGEYERLAHSLLILIPVVIGWALLSWLKSGSHASSASAQAEDYFGNIVFRTGISTNQLIEDLQMRLRAAPDDWQSFSQLGLAYLQKARETGDPSYYQKAEEALQNALASESEDYTSLSAMGALELARHRFQQALTWGKKAQKINPDRTYAYGVVADAQIELGFYPEAVQTLQTMVDLRPDLSSYTRISYIRELNGDPAGALEMMQWAVEGGSSTAENTAWTRTQLGNLYFNRGNLERAETEYQRTLEAMPGYVYAIAGMGRVRAAQGQTDEAISLLNRAIQTMPLPEFIITLADVYQVTGQTEAAQQQHDLLKAIQKLYQANEVDMDLEIALFNADHGIDLQRTVDLAHQAYTRRPSIYAADVLAWALYKTGNYVEAQTYSLQSLRLGTKDALKLFHSGMIHYRLGNHDKARSDLESALAVNPYFSILYLEEAHQILEDLRAEFPGD